MELNGKRVLVVGLGKSGLAAARFLKERGARVTVSDARPATLISELPKLLDEGFMVEAGSHGLLTFRRQDLIVVSPGVPLSTPVLSQVRAMGAHIIGELELGTRFLQGEVVAITGSNGKTTTTTLVGEILKAAGKATLVGGNIGLPVTALVGESVEMCRRSGGEADPPPSAKDDNKKSEGEAGESVEMSRGDGQEAAGLSAPSAKDADSGRDDSGLLAASRKSADSGRDDSGLLAASRKSADSGQEDSGLLVASRKGADSGRDDSGLLVASRKGADSGREDSGLLVASRKGADSGREDKPLERGEGRKNVWSVIEVSSFQLETVETFRPRIAMVLNITPDHLDRHGDFATYAAAKARITEFQTAEDFLVLNGEDKETQMLAAKTKAQVYWFSARRPIKQGAFVHGESILFVPREGAKPEPVMPVAEIPLVGAHNVENVLAAVCAARLVGVPSETIRSAVAGFKAVEHRLEFVREIAGVRYFNDSKATNVDATTKAIEAFAGGIHLILGGKDKDSDYSVLAALLRERVKTVITIGSAAEKIERQLHGVVKIERAETMDRAVAFARSMSVAGDTVLLAPACASFDQFENYEQRGRVFKELVLAL